MALLFVPLASASNSGRSLQTLVLLVLLSALAAEALIWLILRQRGQVSALYLGIAALAGAVASLIGALPAFPGYSRPFASRLVYVALMDGVGLWLFVLALRRLVPRQVRGLAATAIVLLLVGLFPGPTLLLQPGVDVLNLREVEPQLRAGFRYWTVGAALLVAPFLALTTLPGDWFERWWAIAAARVMAIPNRYFAWGIAIAAFALTLALSFYAFDGRPTTADEIAQLWHARILLGGRLALPPDPNPEFFAIDNIIDRPHWMSQFPIGGPAVLAIGLLSGAVWLLNPVLTALTTLNVYRFVRRAYHEPQARAAAALFVASPMVVLMGGSHMNHMPTAWLVTLALAALPVWVASSDPARLRRSAAVIGIALGATIAIRPLDGVVAGLVVGLLMLAFAARSGGRRARARVPSLLVAIAVGVVPIALLLIANWRTTGSPLRFGYEVLWGANHSLGLHDDPTGHPHTAWRALLLGVKYAAQLNWIVMSWPVPILVIVAAGLLLARRRSRWDVFLLAWFCAQLTVYAFYWHDGQFIGPRFLFAAIPALVILVARAPFIAADRLHGVRRRIALVTIPVCIGVAWLRAMPPFGVQGIANEFRESRTRLKLDPPREVRSAAIGDALIFVQEGAATRLLHRLWGLGVSRPNAARLLADADGCSLLEAVRAEERRDPADTLRRVERIRRSVQPFRQSDASPRVPDPNFRVSDSTSVTKACGAELAHDFRIHNTVAYGPMLLLNRFDGAGRIGGPVVYVLDLGERNEVLRTRFGDRRWYRFEVPRDRPENLPVLVPYDSAR